MKTKKKKIWGGGGGSKASSCEEIQVFGAKFCDVQRFPNTYFEFKVVLDIFTKGCTSF